MTDSLIFLPLRLGLRTARASLHATRDLADLGLATLEVVERVLGDEPRPLDPTEPAEPAETDGAPEAAAPSETDGAPDAAAPTEPPRPAPAPPPRVPPPARPAPPAPPPPEDAEEAGVEAVPEPTIADAELVEEFADPGAEDGAGASLRVSPPFDGYDELRAADVIARLGGADMAELGETELYERTHRARRTVLDAIAREIKRRPPNWVDRRP